jgi:hypothetical protein
LKPAELVALLAIAGVLICETGFAFLCGVEQHQMTRLMLFSQHRRQACLELGWLWEADDQENQYKQGSSAGSTATVGPISGFVMDVTENESGHAQGQCHAVTASYKDLVAQY